MRKSLPNLTHLHDVIFGDTSSRLDTGVFKVNKPALIQGIRDNTADARVMTLGHIRKAITVDDDDSDDYFNAIQEAATPVKERRPEIEVEFEEYEEEELPYNGVVGENEFLVEPEEVEAIRGDKERLEYSVSNTMREMVALLYGVDDATNYVESLARDGLGFDIETDDAIEDALVPLTRLTVLLTAINSITNMTDEVKQQASTKLTDLLVTQMADTLVNRKARDQMNEMRKYYAATLAKSGLSPDTHDEETEFNSVGVRMSRRKM